MDDFKKELKRLGDIEFSRIKSKYRSKVDKRGNISSAANNLKVFGDALKETTDNITSIANKLYPKMGVDKESATKVLKERIEKYMAEIKNLSGF
ncbi:hypothetical protein [Arenibacter algicola]|jgi:hypothetical protein|uniref:Uncharacterized protein n=1 Tax=Arenibacter algicola TaxID=616991 RepID=A0A221UVL5_9FLAO|nr:hypothetical protein [Arenibacter algicola]ASO05280.1 hypothetical protein AREALGSMS7_01816 [Arenibacter algicola]HCO86470.1 hypothetical protein [Arenibacter sp.]|tara:strand:+ start:171 stop:452 length:282 start_codon:yes stop_codon:yes gene_type:complete